MDTKSKMALIIRHALSVSVALVIALVTACCVTSQVDVKSNKSSSDVPSGTSSFVCAAQARPTKIIPPPAVEHVFVLMLENADASAALQQPFLKWLAHRGAYLSDYHGITHPSLPNYIALIGGDTFGIKDNTNVSLRYSNLADLLDAAGKTWKSYVEAYPGDCFLGDEAEQYVRRHQSFLQFSNITNKPSRCANVVKASELQVDIRNGTLPDFALYEPGLKNGGHDTDVSYSDRWLQNMFSSLLQNRDFIEHTLFIITFDESANGLDQNNQIYTALYGPSVRAGATSSLCYTHYDLLRTIEEVLGIGDLGRQDVTGVPIQGIWR